MFLFHPSAIEGFIFYFRVRYIGVAQIKFDNQGLIEVKNMIINWGNIIAYFQNYKQRKILADWWLVTYCKQLIGLKAGGGQAAQLQQIMWSIPIGNSISSC